MTIHEVAVALGLSVDAVRSRQRRGLFGDLFFSIGRRVYCDSADFKKWLYLQKIKK